MELAAVLDSMTDGVFVCDERGTLIAVNKAGLRILGAKDLAEVNRTSPPFHFPEGRDEDGTPIHHDHAPLARALCGNTIIHQLEIVDHKGGRLVLRTRTAPIRDQSGAIVGAVKIATDVTHEYELERLKDDFIRVAAHELKTPITIIKSNAEAMVMALPDLVPGARRLFDALLRGVDRIDRMVGSLLDLVDLQGGILSLSRRTLRLDRLLTDVVSQLPGSAAARIRLASAAPIEIRGDPRRLRQVTRALVDNAIKYSPLQSPVEVALEQTARSALLTIRDHGVGIPREQATRIFEKFFRAHAGTPKDAGGIGVGLFVAREIVAQHGGRIWFESIENEGTVFHVELPLSGEPE